MVIARAEIHPSNKYARLEEDKMCKTWDPDFAVSSLTPHQRRMIVVHERAHVQFGQLASEERSVRLAQLDAFEAGTTDKLYPET